LLVALPLVAWLLYGQWGALGQVQLGAQLEQYREGDNSAEQVQAILENLEKQAARDPDNEQTWNLMSRLYMSEQRYAEAAGAFQQLSRLYPEDANVLARYAQALYLANDNEISPFVQGLIERVMRLDPHQPTLLGMLGMNAFERADYQKAVDYWSRLVAVLPPDSPDARMIRSGIDQARTMGGLVQPAEKEDTPQGVASIEVGVSLAEGIEANPSSTVYVYARALQGPKMPLAVARLTVADLPTKVVLDDSMAMAPELTLSSFRQVNLVARISLDGDVMASPGDVEGVNGPVATADGSPVQIVIDTVINK
jgi:cytochrome c-type biogenesis protein CcmH